MLLWQAQVSLLKAGVVQEVAVLLTGVVAKCCTENLLFCLAITALLPDLREVLGKCETADMTHVDVKDRL